MKKLLAGSLVLLAVLEAAALLSPWGLPREEDLVPDPARSGNGLVWAAENRPFTSRIYCLGEGGIESVYRESRLRGGGSRIARVAADGERVYFLRVLENGGTWELVQLENGTASLLYRDAVRPGLEVTGLAAKADTFWFTAILDTGAVCVYEYTESGGSALKLVFPPWWVRGAVSARYDGVRTRATVSFGSCFLNNRGDAVYTEEAAEPPPPRIEPAGSSWLLVKRDCLLGTLILWIVLSAVLLTAAWICRRARRLSLRFTAVGGAWLLAAFLAAEAVVLREVFRAAGLSGLRDAGRRTGLLLLGTWLAALPVFRIAAGRITRLLPAMAGQMERVAAGDTAVREAPPGRDELHRMNRSLQELCMSLSIRNYELDCTVRSYSRFIPHGLTMLLDRAAVAEVSPGDSRRITGSVGLFSVGNRADVRAALEDSRFLEFINGSLSLFHRSVGRNNGCLISGGLRLSRMEALFPAAADGVRAGLELLGRVREDTEGLPAPDPFLLMHQASFLYGVTGGEERLFPYLSSLELEFLEGLAPRLYEAGVRIAVTEALQAALPDGLFSLRRIGAVSDGEGRFSQALYEVLDALSPSERKLRLQYDPQFQEAVGLFCRNDFYLARNCFSALLRVCPGDGIARWYLFACERFFNRGGGCADHRLFGPEGPLLPEEIPCSLPARNPEVYDP